MSMRVPLPTTTGGQTGASIQLRLDDPPYIFLLQTKDSNGVTLGGTLTIEESVDTMPDSQGWFTDAGVPDANAQWQTIISGLAPGSQTNWTSPLKRIRVNASGITPAGANVKVYMLVSVRSLKSQRPPRTRPNRAQTNAA